MEIVEHRVWFLAWPGIQALDLVGPHEVFAAANRVADGMDRHGPRYRTRVVSAEATVVPSESGLALHAEAVGPRSGPGPHTLVLPGGDGVHQAAADRQVTELVAALAQRADRLATVCTGAFLAAAAGLLEGRRVATHWARARRLSATNPGVEVDAEAIHLCDREGGDLPVWSSAGVTAGIDLALAMVEHDHDPEVAQVVGRWLVVHLRRPGGQSQFAAPMWAPPSSLAPVRAAQSLVQAGPAEDHSVAALAARVGVSARHLTRLFAADTGETPGRYVERIRVDLAREELEAGAADLAAVARRCGFGTTETLRRAFHRRLGVAPDDYRRRFRLEPAT
ncbi:MAG: helix-turn-helix domain-containing protein [Actinomycetota bacterium]